MSPGESQPENSDSDEPLAPPRRRVKIGVALIVLSGVLFGALPVIPFLQLAAGQKVLLAAVVYAAVQIAWWAGAALAGPTFVRRMWTWIRKRLTRKQPRTGDSDE